MNSAYKISAKDMALLPSIFKFTTPAEIPLSFEYGDRAVRGIPEEFSPSVSYRILTANTVQYIIDGTDAHGLNIRAEYIEYRDYPVTEWVF